MIDPDLLSILPREATSSFRSLLGEDPLPAADLSEQVLAHLGEIREAARHNEFLDVDLAERLAIAAQAMITLADRERDAQRRGVLQAAVRYFVHEQDGLPDTRLLSGLDDDASVLSAVARHLDLRIPELS